ncbi:hypothetical protein Pecwa_2576 [Pectobacterium parmentieri WPP163]|nr:hypothetical protein Pecwa_2576 [Pectobacterium parmentieri WPP163]
MQVMVLYLAGTGVANHWREKEKGKMETSPESTCANGFCYAERAVVASMACANEP